MTAPAEQRHRNWRIGLHASGMLFFLTLGLSGIWVIMAPAADHPILAGMKMVRASAPNDS